ncbi:MAG: hypothetical protein ACXVYM_06140 [Gaiellaceae bacterium]
MRWLMPLLLLPLLLATGFSAASPPTNVHRFAAFQGTALAPGLQAGPTQRGYCWEGSMADYGRADAWRCFRGNEILDPCFSRGASARPYVVCPRFPWSGRAVLLQLTKPLPLTLGNKASRSADPWAIVAGNGKRCTLITGATSLIHGLRVSYGCTDGSVLAGSPDRHATTWTIYSAPDAEATRLTRVAISDAWS